MWSPRIEQLGQPSSHSGANIKWYTINWLRSSNSSANVFFPLGVSNTYLFSTFTHGSWRRSAARASPCRVCCFSFSKNCFRAATQSSCDTTFGLSTVVVVIAASPLLPGSASFFHRDPHPLHCCRFHGQWSSPPAP